MAELYPVDLNTHLDAVVSEFRARQTIYGYPARKMFRGFDGVDFSVHCNGRRAATPIGPAAGPHTQMAQNILLSFLGGGRIIELKTIQIRDQLRIPRPCIDIRNIGYNIEWSQELRLEDSYREYVSAWVLLKLIEALELLQVPAGDPFYDTIFDISVGYDLQGIASPRVAQWLRGMRDASALIDQLLAGLPPRFAHLRRTAIEPKIANAVTLSTFHGCPRDEIEAIVQHLIDAHGFHVVVKMNPTLLGYDAVREILHEQLGYRHIALPRQAFEQDLQFDEAVAMLQRLRRYGRERGCEVGAKFTNTLVVHNRGGILPQAEQYLSGAPLHVIAMQTVLRFREAVGADFPVSFSAGISKHNIAEAVACHMKPVTACTDLLKTGGYTRQFDYLVSLQRAMQQAGARDIDGFIRATAGVAATEPVAAAGMANLRRLVPGLAENPRYHYRMNRKAPPKIDSHLTLFDCITCNKCLPVCPNAANFSIATGTLTATPLRLRFRDGGFETVGQEAFVLEKSHQIANLADFCNECGNCDTYCPEHGGPFIEKPRFFFSEGSYTRHSDLDGFYFPAPQELVGRITGQEYRLRFDADQQEYHWHSAAAELVLDSGNRVRSGKISATQPESVEIDLEPFYIMRTLLDGMLSEAENYPAILLRAGREQK